MKDQTDNPPTNALEGAENLPEPLIQAIRSADTPLPLITARVDRRIDQLARAQFAPHDSLQQSFGQARKSPRWRRPAAWTAMAASVLLALTLVVLQVAREPTAPTRDLLYTDVDGSGRIDIADVFALARSSVASQAELDTFARQIVSLEQSRDAS